MLEDLRIREFSKDEARQLNPLQLALIGDGVFEIYIRNFEKEETICFANGMTCRRICRPKR